MTDTAVATTPRRQEIRVVTDEVPIYDTAKFEHMQRIASVMARCALVPMSLRGNDLDTAIANCFLVVNQAVRWGMDPFAVAQCSSVIKGKLTYEGKLVHAVMQCHGVNLTYEFNNKPGDALGVRVRGTLPEEDKEREVIGTVGQWKTDNEMWRRDPHAMLCYRGARAWSRIHNPGPMLGVLTPDELETEPAVPRSPPPLRPSGAAQYDQFAGNVRRTKDEPGESQDAEPAKAPSELSSPTDDAGSRPGSTDPNGARASAWHRGANAKLKGEQKRALPGEYRTLDRTAEARAWGQGWSGEPLDTEGTDAAK